MPLQIRTLPVLDLSLISSSNPADVARFVAELRHACLHVGFFYVTNHGVDEALQREMVEEARAFFRLPLAEKMEIEMKRSPHFRGYTKLGEWHWRGRKMSDEILTMQVFLNIRI